MWTLSGRNRRAVDGAMALGAALANVVGVAFPDEDVAYEFGGQDSLTHMAVAAGVGLILWWRRTAPLGVFVTFTAVVTTVTLVHWDPGMLPLTYFLAAYALGAYAATREAVGGLLLGLAAMGVMVLAHAPYFDSWLAIGAPIQLVLAWVLGLTVRTRRQRADVANACRTAIEHNGAVATERAILEDRLRVARDLHDSVSAALTVITIQACAARARSIGANPATLADIEATSRIAMEELRGMVAALRSPAPDAPLDPKEEALRTSLSRATGWEPTPSATSAPSTVTASTVANPSDWPVDLTLALTLAALNVTGSVIEDDSSTLSYTAAPLPPLILLAALPGLSLVLRRRHAALPLAVVLASLTIMSALNWQVGNLPGTLLVASFAVGAWSSLRVGAATMIVLNTYLVGLAIFASSPFEEWAAPASPLFFTLPWVVGAVLRRARVSAERDIEAARAATLTVTRATERAIADERLSVARDLHDLVSHNLAAVTVQAATARHTAGDDDTLRIIEDTSRAAMGDLRRLLVALNSDAPDLPAPGLRELTALAATHRRTHGAVTLRVGSDVEDEPASLRLTVFRVVQEALTNVGRHAHGAAANVEVRCTADRVLVIVEDDGRSDGVATTQGGAFGLTGMRERVTLAGGNLTVGRTPGGGFRVQAELARAEEHRQATSLAGRRSR